MIVFMAVFNFACRSVGSLVDMRELQSISIATNTPGGTTGTTFGGIAI